MTKPKFRIRKVGKYSIWASTGYPWKMLCRRCGRAGHHTQWQVAMMHAQLHDCRSGSLW